jgi:hypothetical protein
MRGAPPVRMDCGRDARWCWFHHVLFAVAAATASGWLAAHLEMPGAMLGLGLAAGVVLGGLWSVRSRASQGLSCLVWDGRSWCLDGQTGVVDVMIDLGSWMLLRFVGGAPGPARWLPLTLAQAGAPAHRCRAALLDHAATTQAADAHPPVAPNG